MNISIKDVARYFERYGWSYRLLEGETTIISGFKGEIGYFKIATELQNGWLSVYVLDFLPEIREDLMANVCKLALELNAKTKYVRFELIEKNQITIVADIPAHTRLDYDLFAMSLDLISFYADQGYPKLCELLQCGETKED